MCKVKLVNQSSSGNDVNSINYIDINASKDKERDYFAKVTDLYKKYGLTEADGSFVPKQITWSMDESGNLSATIK